METNPTWCFLVTAGRNEYLNYLRDEEAAVDQKKKKKKKTQEDGGVLSPCGRKCDVPGDLSPLIVCDW